MFDAQLAPIDHSYLTTLQFYSSDYELVLKQFVIRYGDRHPIFYWNNGYQCLVKLSLEQEQLRYYLIKQPISENPLALIQQKKLPAGFYLFDNLLDFELMTVLERSIRESQIFNCANRLLYHSQVKVVLLGEWVQLSPKLRLKIAQIKLGLPTDREIESVLKTQLPQNPPVKLISACQGLAWGDIHYEIEKFQSQQQSITSASLEVLTQQMMALKEERLNHSDLNLEYFSQPEIPRMGGNEILNQFLADKLSKLNEPNARHYGLKPPRAMLFVGPPGTGKSLRAKMTAKALGYTLLGISFGDIIGADNPDRVISRLLELAESLGKVILFLDDWDKGLADWESGGSARRLVQKLLTWMQEHSSPVITIATVNRIELLPIELLRRFDDGGIWMIDLPNRGEIYDIFNIYLNQYFPHQFTASQPQSVSSTPWSKEQWTDLLDAAEECTPVEIADVVKTCLADWYCSLPDCDRVAYPSGNRASKECSPIIEFNYLLNQVNQIEKASVRAAESIQAMRNNAWFARPASSPDNSPFKLEEEALLGGG
ncbi:MAG: hypothetical protein RLZZ69_3095 [Cyanobacteriota bacterium]